MDDKRLKCSKCGGDMQAGCVMSPSKSWVGIVLHPNLAEWYAGVADSSFWEGYTLPKEKYPVTVYRCKQCGFLECYAQ